MLTVMAGLALGPAPARGSAATSAAPGVTGCAWAVQIGDGGVDGYDADLDAGYWLTSFLATPGAGLTIDGLFPQARYMSITAYNASDPTLSAHLYDAEIEPDGGLNPFQAGVDPSASGTYELRILAEPAPADPAPNTLYVGNDNALVSVLYRVYAAGDPSDPTGGAGLPQVSTTFGGVVTGTRGGCVASDPGGAPPASGAQTAARARSLSDPTWTAPTVTRLPNPDAGYLEASIDQLAGEVVVIRAEMPTFPDTNAGAPAWSPAQVRYWSLCDYAQDALVASGCLPDYAAVQSGGIATFVLSAPADRPANATTESGVNWIPWGGAALGLIVYRQLLAAPSFGQSIAAAAAGGSLVAGMGTYFPQIAYCSVAVFESVGADGCLGAGSVTGSPSNAGSGSGSGSGVAARAATPARRAGTTLSRAAVAARLRAQIAPSGPASRIPALLRARGYTFTRYRLPGAGAIDLRWWYRDHARRRRVLVATAALARRTGSSAVLAGPVHMRLTAAGVALLGHGTRLALTGVARYAAAGHGTVTVSREFTLAR